MMGMILIILISIVAYGEDTTTFNDLKQGDTVWLNEKETKVSSKVLAVGNPNQIYIYLDSDPRNPIVGSKDEKITTQKLTKVAPPVPTPAPAPAATPAPTPVQPAAGITPAPQTTYKPANELTQGDKIIYNGEEKEIANVDYSVWSNSYTITFKDGTTTNPESAGIPVQVITAPAPPEQPAAGTQTPQSAPVKPMDMSPANERLLARRAALEELDRRSKGEGESKPINWGSLAAEFLSSYDQYRGFARFGSLFFTDESWEAYREKVNQIFCDTILLGGTQCWTSRICDTQLYPIMPRSTFSGRTPSGQRVAVATIQGEKSLPIAAVDKQGNPIDMRLYKVTYAITNPYDQQEIKYNVQFRTEDGNTINWYPEQQTLGPGSSAAITEASPIIEYGRKNYNTVCLTFNPGITDYAYWHGKTIHEWCSPVIQYEGTATKPYPEATNDPETTPEEPATSTEPPILPAGTSMREDF